MTDLQSIKIPNDPGDAMAAALALRALADQVERNAVRKALDDGWTWGQIAEALGVTKQAAHKKHAAHMARG